MSDIPNLIERLEKKPLGIQRREISQKHAEKIAQALRDLQADADIHDEQLTKVARLRLDLESENIKLRAVAEAAKEWVKELGPIDGTLKAWTDLSEALANLDKRVQPLASEADKGDT